MNPWTLKIGHGFTQKKEEKPLEFPVGDLNIK